MRGRKWRSALIATWIACASVAGVGQAASQDAQAARGSQSAGRQAASAPEARVDINHASVSELMQVPGMTATWAARIVRFRPYRTKQDLLDKGVVTSQVYDRIKDSVIAHRDPHPAPPVEQQ